jgi:hypothetical protein
MPGPKKSETLEVRLPHAAKQAFMVRCQARGATASEAVRAFIEADIGQPAQRSDRRLHWIAAAAVAIGFGVMAAPSLARPSLPAEFARLDADHDQRLSPVEFAGSASLQVAVTLGPARLIPVVHGPDALPAVRRELVAAEFGRIDLDRDGEISFAEFRRYYAR